MTNLRNLKKWSKKIGRRGENAAADLLEFKGISVLARNCRTNRGEIDVVAMDGGTLVFVEVKTRYRRPFSRKEVMPYLNLTAFQKRRIYRAALTYVRELGNPPVRYRFDIIEVITGVFGTEKILHHVGAFGREKLFKPYRSPSDGYAYY